MKMQPFVCVDREDALAGAGIVGLLGKSRWARLFISSRLSLGIKCWM